MSEEALFLRPIVLTNEEWPEKRGDIYEVFHPSWKEDLIRRARLPPTIISRNLVGTWRRLVA
jgi:hypothetical protein